jgi:two-component system alkaline phosphatase synthesis response regulator PhoP
MPHRILVVEDEPGLVMTLTDRLRAEGYEVDIAMDGESGLNKALEGGYHLIILDLMLPRMSGLDICRNLRKSGAEVPILMLTARAQTIDKIVGLEVGADDYLTKPFDMMELRARIGALLRRAASRPAAKGVHEFGSVRVDFRSGEVTKAGKPVTLSAKEYQLLRHLIDHQGEVISREKLLQEVWGYEAMPSTRTVDVHMAWLRQKLEDNPRYPEFLHTARGLGYKFVG